MAFLDGVFNKPRANFEKSCSDFQLFALCDLTNVTKIKAKNYRQRQTLNSVLRKNERRKRNFGE